MRKIENLKQLNALIGSTYIHAVIFAVIALLIAFVIAIMIKYQGGKNARDHVKRRVWFIIIGILSFIIFFLYNSFYVVPLISKAPLQAKFLTAMSCATLVVLVIYALVGIVTMKIWRRSKWGSILGKPKK